MIKKIQTVEFQASTNLVLRRSDTVTLTANLSDLELERITAEHGPLVFGTDEGGRHHPRCAQSANGTMDGRRKDDDGEPTARRSRWPASMSKPHVIGETWIYTVVMPSERGSGSSRSTTATRASKRAS